MKIGQHETHPAADLLPLLAEGELAALASDVKANGLREEIVLHESRILDGRNRYLACERAGVAPRFKEWKGSGSPTAWVLSMNLHRRHLTAGQKADVAERALPILEDEAKARQVAAAHTTNAGRGRTHDPKTVQERIPEASPRKPAPQARDLAAQIVGVNPRYVSDMKAIRAKAPEIADRVRSGELSLPAARAKLKRIEIAERVAAEPVALSPGLFRRVEDAPAGRYRTIYMDPPWAYADEGVNGSAATQYHTMGVEAIERLPVARLAHADGCHLWMWTTWPMIREGAPHRLVAAWGFRWVGEVTWKKDRVGTGRWLRSITEVLVLAVRGSMPLLVDDAAGFLEAPRGRHSEKPKEARALVERCSPGPRLEVFARHVPEGWDAVGLEVERVGAS